MEVPKDPQRLRRANQRLEAALAAVGNSPAIRRVYDQSDDPPEPIGDLDFTNKDKDDGPGGLESLVMLGSAAIEAPAMSTHVPAEALITKHRGLEEQIDAIQNRNIQSRSLLREIEALLSRAMSDDGKSGGGGGGGDGDGTMGALALAPAPPTTARATAFGARPLPPSTSRGATPRGGLQPSVSSSAGGSSMRCDASTAT